MSILELAGEGWTQSYPQLALGQGLWTGIPL